jgi:NADPH-dependent 2,4-dienoyl-CoA reductase/sulfur reductase-like enzyme
MSGMKVIIVGGVEGGVSCAAKLRSLDEDAEILLIERGQANFKAIDGINCRTLCEVIGISVKNKSIQLQNIKNDAISIEKYDKLVLAPEMEPEQPPLPGMDLPGVYSLRALPEALNIHEWLNQCLMERMGLKPDAAYEKVMKPERAVVVGGGLIGLEIVEYFIRLGLEVTLIEKLNQMVHDVNTEMAGYVETYLIKLGVRLELIDEVTRFEKSRDGSLEVITCSGRKHPADIVIRLIKLKPGIHLARMAGIRIGKLGGIRVDEHLRTSNPDIFAVGDSIEVMDLYTGQWKLVPQAGEANRQGCIAANVIKGHNLVYRGAHRVDLNCIRAVDVLQGEFT